MPTWVSRARRATGFPSMPARLWVAYQLVCRRKSPAIWETAKISFQCIAEICSLDGLGRGNLPLASRIAARHGLDFACQLPPRRGQSRV